MAGERVPGPTGTAPDGEARGRGPDEAGGRGGRSAPGATGGRARSRPRRGAAARRSGAGGATGVAPAPPTITIPVDAHLITLQIESFRTVTTEVSVGGRAETRQTRVRDVRDVPPRHDEASLRRAFDVANGILAPAGLAFALRRVISESAAAPGDMETVDVNGFGFLARQFPAPPDGVSLLAVSRFQSTDLGGQAVEDWFTCIVAFLGDPLTGKTLAHEFGHLLGLGHEDGANFNLMYPALRAADDLTPGQVGRARGSRLVVRASAPPAATP